MEDPPQSSLSKRFRDDDDETQMKQQDGRSVCTQEEKELLRSSSLWYGQNPDKRHKKKTKKCLYAVRNAYSIARRTRGNMSDVLQDGVFREKLLEFAFPILRLKQYSQTLTERIAFLSSKYETAQTVSGHANPSDGLLDRRGNCIACSLTVTHPLAIDHALKVLSKFDQEIVASGENEHSARMLNTLLIMKEMMAIFGIYCTASEDNTNKIDVIVPHENGEIVSTEKLCDSCKRKSEKAIFSCAPLDTMTDLASFIRTCLLQLESHLHWQECLFIGLIDSVHELFTAPCSLDADPTRVDLGGGTYGLLSMRPITERALRDPEKALVETAGSPFGVWFATRPKRGL